MSLPGSFETFLLFKLYVIEISSFAVFLVWMLREVLHATGIHLPIRSKVRIDTMQEMPHQPCRVSIVDLHGVEHTAQVTADTVFEAVARGLKVITHSKWAGELAEGITTITVCATQPGVEHRVKFQDFEVWLNRTTGTPAEMAQRKKVQAILATS